MPAPSAAAAWSAVVRPAALAALLAPPSAEDGERAPDPYRTVVDPREPTAVLDAQRQLDARSPGFATAVDLEEQPGTPADGLPEVIARTPGATVRSLGGLGQFAAVSLRGSSPQQVAVFLDGVPLTSSVAGLVDLSSLPLDGLSRVEVYRGHVPVAFGSAAIGGAIDLVGAPAWRQAGVTLHGGLGSFGAHEARLTLRGPLGHRDRSAGSIALGHTGARGDFPFIDDGRTPDLRGDDAVALRRNNDYQRTAVHARFDHRRGPWRLSLQQLVLAKQQGIPGTAMAQSRQARLSTAVSRTTGGLVRYGAGGPGGRLSWRWGVGLSHQTFEDPRGEVGLGIDDQRVLGADLYLSPRVRLPLWRDAYLGLVADQRLEFVDVDERTASAGASGDARRSRSGWGAGLQLEQFVWDSRWLVVPVVRVDALRSRFAVPPGSGEQDDQGRDADAVGLAPRLGTRLRVAPGLEVRASGGQYFRPPTLTELFGDRGYIQGNEGLRPEHGQSVDGGIVVDHARPRMTVYAQLAGFGSRSEDLIQWVSAGSVARPINIDGATMRGLDSSVAVIPTRRWLTLHANYTYLDARRRSPDPALDGKQLPGRPRHELFARATAGHRFRAGVTPIEPRVLYTIEVISGTTLDTNEQRPQPTRALQGLGVQVQLGARTHVGVEVRNLLDVRTAPVMLADGSGARSIAVADFIGYPLPGRSVWGSLRIDAWRRP